MPSRETPKTGSCCCGSIRSRSSAFRCRPITSRLGQSRSCSRARRANTVAADLPVAEDFAQRASIALENARLYEEAKEADRRKDEFLATLAHELRNPLAPVRNALEIVRTAGIDGNVAGKAFTVIERQVDHMVRLVDDLLDLSRLMRGKIQLRPERLYLGDVITRAIETARPLIDSHGHELVVNAPQNAVELYADPVRLDQIISNLLNNAAKYTERGGVIRLIAKARGKELVIKIRDTGIGIDPKLLPHLFDLFRQAESSLDRSHGGLGIGLTLVRSLVEMHGGKVAARSDGLGTGAEFVVHLPIHKKQASAPEIICTDPQRISSPHFQILVVDDNVDAAEMLSTLLQLDGHRVWAVHDGRAALEAAQTHRPDVILLDIGLPELNGYEVAKWLRAHEAFRRTIVIAMSGFGQERDCQQSLEAGCDAHLTKPVAPQALRDFLRPQQPGPATNLTEVWEGEAPAEPFSEVRKGWQAGSAGASPSHTRRAPSGARGSCRAFFRSSER